MKFQSYLLFSLILSMLAACGTDGETSSRTTASIDNFSVKNTEASATEGDFIYRLISEKEEYPSGGPVEIYAELEYIGDQETIDIFHAGSAFFFPMEEQSRDYQLDYPMTEPLITTTLTKGEPLHKYYGGSGVYSNQDEVTYIEFVKNIMNLEFPEGYYIVNGYADFYTETPDNGQTNYEIHAEIDFKVVDK